MPSLIHCAYYAYFETVLVADFFFAIPPPDVFVSKAGSDNEEKRDYFDLRDKFQNGSKCVLQR